MRPTTRLKRVPALIGAVALVTASLAGCSALPGAGGCDPAYASGDASKLVTATGEVGSTPDVDFPTPLVVGSAPEVTRLVAGDGAAVARDGQVDYAVSYFTGQTGEQLGATGYGATGSEDAPARSAVGLDTYSISTAFECMSVGDRFSLVTSAADAFGEGAQQSVPDDAAIVVVIDVLDTFRGKADGVNQLPQDGMPVVVTAVDGTPAIALGLIEKPDHTRAATIKGGDGATARDDETVHVHLRAWTWPDVTGDEPPEFASTWAEPQQSYDLTLDADESNPVPQAVRDAITGAKVGSQLLVVIAPGDGSYVTPPQGVDPEATMIWVVDLLGIQK